MMDQLQVVSNQQQEFPFFVVVVEQTKQDYVRPIQWRLQNAYWYMCKEYAYI